MTKLLALIAALCVPLPAVAQQWEHRYTEADNADTLSVCLAGVYYSDGPFLARLYEQTLDFFLEDDSFALPPSQSLGTVDFVFSNARYTLPADSGEAAGSSGTARHMFISPVEDDVSAILQSLRSSGNFDIVFPDGSSFTITLDGSEAALREAFTCWSDRETGGGGVNPFAGNGDDGNPFD